MPRGRSKTLPDHHKPIGELAITQIIMGSVYYPSAPLNQDGSVLMIWVCALLSDILGEVKVVSYPSGDQHSLL